MRKASLLLIVLIYMMVSISLGSCRNTSYSFRAFSYPPGSQPHQDNWEYSGTVVVTSQEKGSLSKKSAKSVYIVVKDKSKRTYLSDRLEFHCGQIDSSIKWDKFEELEIILYEVGNEFADNEYNKELLKKGPIRLCLLKYRYDSASREFERAAVVPGTADA
jgi:hypothetical protein